MSISNKIKRIREALYFKSTVRLPPFLKLRVRSYTPVVIYFHEIGEEKDHIKNLYSHHTEKSFCGVLEKLLKHFRPLQDLSPNGFKNASTRDFVITFDDGLLSSYEIAAPILEKKGIPCVFFVNSNFINGAETFHRFEVSLLMELLKTANKTQIEKATRLFMGQCENKNFDLFSAIFNTKYGDKDIFLKNFELFGVDPQAYFKQNKPFMTLSQVRNLHERGFWIGAHSCNHPRYSEINQSEQIHQTLADVKFWQKELKLKYSYFAFPFSAQGVNPSFYKETKQHIDLFFTTGGLRKPNYKANTYNRISMDDSNCIFTKIKSS